MRPWKAVLGVGAACAACCAVPLVGGLAALTAGTAALAAAGSALLACADEFAPFATGLLVLAGVGGAVTWWVCRRRRNRTPGPSVAADPAQRQLLQALPQVVGAVTSQGLWLQPSGRPGSEATIKRPCGALSSSALSRLRLLDRPHSDGRARHSQRHCGARPSAGAGMTITISLRRRQPALAVIEDRDRPRVSKPELVT